MDHLEVKQYPHHFLWNEKWEKWGCITPTWKLEDPVWLVIFPFSWVGILWKHEAEPHSAPVPQWGQLRRKGSCQHLVQPWWCAKCSTIVLSSCDWWGCCLSHLHIYQWYFSFFIQTLCMLHTIFSKSPQKSLMQKKKGGGGLVLLNDIIHFKMSPPHSLSQSWAQIFSFIESDNDHLDLTWVAEANKPAWVSCLFNVSEWSKQANLWIKKMIFLKPQPFPTDRNQTLTCPWWVRASHQQIWEQELIKRSKWKHNKHN